MESLRSTLAPDPKRLLDRLFELGLDPVVVLQRPAARLRVTELEDAERAELVNVVARIAQVVLGISRGFTFFPALLVERLDAEL